MCFQSEFSFSKFLRGSVDGALQYRKGDPFTGNSVSQNGLGQIPAGFSIKLPKHILDCKHQKFKAILPKENLMLA